LGPLEQPCTANELLARLRILLAKWLGKKNYLPNS